MHGRLITKKNQSGQAVMEYVLLLTVVSLMYLFASSYLRGSAVGKSISNPIQKDFAFAYRYGHPKARGLDDPDGPKLHPRISSSYAAGNFRLYINPK